MRSGLRRLRARTAGELPDEAGFTIIEMMVALTILAITMMSLAYGVFGGMRVLQAGRHKTTFLELANAEAEKVRALNYEAAGVHENDPALDSAYPPVGSPPQNQFNGRQAVIISAADFPASAVPDAVEAVPAGTATNRPPHTIRRWVTWTDPTAGTEQRFKRIDVTIEWNEPNGQPRSVSYTTLFYPGDLGPIETNPPTAAFSASPTVGFAGNSFAFDGSASTDHNTPALALTYDWDFGPGETPATGVTTTKVFSTVGRKTVSLVVTNSAGVSSAPVSQNILVGTAPGTPAPPGNVGPSASFSATPTSDAGPLSLSVDASASTDANGDPLTYIWNWGDGTPNGRGVSAGHVYPDEGVYTVVLTVTDPAGYSSSASTAITVTTPTCTVKSGSFKNPGTNTINNDITIANSDRPVNPQFVFTAVTNPACTGMKVEVPTQSGPFASTLVLQSSTATTKTWGLTTSDSSKYNTGASQSATFTATGDAGAVPFTVSFSVHR